MIKFNLSRKTKVTLFLTLLLVGTYVSSAHAKAFGTEIDRKYGSVPYPDGNGNCCVDIVTESTFYFFWVPFSSTETETVCSPC